MLRTIIKIDEEACNGCGLCVSGCHEGALRLINGKAVMVSELYCDGLGACIGECPVGAISLEEREAEPYDETAVMQRLLPKGIDVVVAHLNHLQSSGEKELLRLGLEYLEENGITIPFNHAEDNPVCGCPGTMNREIKRNGSTEKGTLKIIGRAMTHSSELRQFPVQLHLLNPDAGFLHRSHLLLAADCTAFSCGDFHSRFLKCRSLAIACPKLDSSIDMYIEKLSRMIESAELETITVLIMEVPCCGGLVRIAEAARARSKHLPVKVITLSVEGDVINEKWI